MRVAALYRYPIKGFSPEPLHSITLDAGGYVPGDRIFAVENGPSGFDPAAPRHQPKIKYLQLMRDERLATLRTSYDAETATLTIRHGTEEVSASTASGNGRHAIEDFLQRFMGDEARGALRLLAAPAGYRFTDSPTGYVSLLGRESVDEIGRRLGRPLDPLRFRANIVVEGLAPFAELDLAGASLHGAGGLQLEVTRRTVRCAAVNVDPGTGARDAELPRWLLGELGHMDCGVYARVVRGGGLATGDALDVRQGDAAAT